MKETRELIKEINEGLNRAVKNTNDGDWTAKEIFGHWKDFLDIKKEAEDWKKIIAELKKASILNWIFVGKQLLGFLEKAFTIHSNLTDTEND